MLCFEFPKQTKETLSALYTWETGAGRERDLSGAGRLILTEWALKVKFPEFICVLRPPDWPSFLILDFALPEISVQVQSC